MLQENNLKLLYSYSYDKKKIEKRPFMLLAYTIFLIIWVPWHFTFIINTNNVSKEIILSVTLIALFFLTTFMHELVHASTGSFFGCTPILKWSCCLFKGMLSKNHFIVTAAAPLCILSIVYSILILTIPHYASLFFFCFGKNALGSIGDLLFIKKVYKTRDDCLISVSSCSKFEVFVYQN